MSHWNQSGGATWRHWASRWIALSFLLACLGGVTACGRHSHGYIVVAAPPPPPRAEVVITSPGETYVWVPGHWRWRSGAYVWIAGSWQRPPRERAVWVEPRYEQRGDGWVYIAGYWRF
jgi:hypothetical protein